jgi:endo-1,4-beta-mannosidase
MTVGGYPYIGCAGTFNDEQLIKWFSELKQIGVTAVRFWLFQRFTKSGTDFSRLDYLIELANSYGIKLIPVFENQWSACTEGGYKYNTWYRSGYLLPYGKYPLSLKSYILAVVPRYESNTAIMMWQIMNEAESHDEHGNSDPQALYDFARDVSTYIRSLDSNHLISLGTRGVGEAGTAGDDYRRLHSLPNIDLLEFHDYHGETNPMPVELSNRIRDSNALNKPLFVGEAGIASDCEQTTDDFTCYTQVQRADLFKAKINRFIFYYGGTGYLIWSYRNANGIADFLDFDSADPLAHVVNDVASRLR